MVYNRGSSGRFVPKNRYTSTTALPVFASASKYGLPTSSMNSNSKYARAYNVGSGTFLNRPQYVDIPVTPSLTTKKVTDIVRKQVLDNKQKIVIQAATDIKHENIYVFNPFGNIPIGTGDGSRLSDCIHVKSVNIKMLIGNYNQGINLNDVTWRYSWVKSKKEYQAGLDTISNVATTSDFQVQGSTIFTMANYDYDKGSVLLDKRLKTGPNQASQVNWQVLEFDLPIPSGGLKFQYQTQTGNYGKLWNYYLLVGANLPAIGSAGVTICGYMYMDSVVNFTDGR